MKNILMFCDTPFQVMMCIHLKRTQLRGNRVDMIISNHIVNNEVLIERLKKENIFDNVVGMNAYEIDYHKNQYKDFNIKGGFVLRSISNIINRKKIIEQSPLDSEKLYDEFWCTDILESTNIIYDHFLKNNKLLKLICFEEGPVSFLCDQNNQFDDSKYGNVNSLVKAVSTIIGFKMIYGNYHTVYSSVLNLSKKKYYFKIKEIPKLNESDEEYLNIINRIWDYIPNDEYEGKVVFFEESFSLNGIENKDFEIVRDLRNIVGREKLLIKLHPRTRVNRFRDLDVNISENTCLPWELVALNNAGECILVSVSSGSIIHPQLYWGINQKSICLANCEEYHFKQLDKEYYKTFVKICREKNVALLPHNKKELFCMIDKYFE